MKFSWVADEFLFATIILNSPFRNNVINNNLLYYKRPYRSVHPHVLMFKDVDKLKASNYFLPGNWT
jgi:hypothetical protein